MTGFTGDVGFTGYIQLVYVLVAVLFVVGLHLMNSPATARRGNQVAMAGMIIAVVATLVLMIHAGTVTTTGWIVLIAGALIGSGVGLYAARTVQMTAMPQLVSAFNSVGGGAAALVAIYGYYEAESHAGGVLGATTVFTVLDVLIGSVTFSGSIIAAGKLQGFIPSQPLVFKGGRLVNVALAVIAIGTGAFLFSTASLPAMLILVLAALGFGVMMVLPIGGADMPVVISLLNAFTGTAVAMAGFVIGNWALIVAGALVGASGSILTKLMADAMNRSLANIIVGGFGTGDAAVAIGGPVDAQVRSIAPDDAAIQLAYASKVIIVPGYGLAAAQAQHGVAELAKVLEDHGVEVSYAIHPVAGRMPGHMNVLLAEANVPYPQLKEMDEINPEFARTDVALVIGANDVTNPAARRPGNEISGMPILDVDQAKSIIVVKRSMGHGYAGIDNELYYNPKTSMYFADAKKAMAGLTAAVKTLVG
jgi:H+-translocating NAD(P) transhydrogenase subunit beta